MNMKRRRSLVGFCGLAAALMSVPVWGADQVVVIGKDGPAKGIGNGNMLRPGVESVWRMEDGTTVSVLVPASLGHDFQAKGAVERWSKRIAEGTGSTAVVRNVRAFLPKGEKPPDGLKFVLTVQDALVGKGLGVSGEMDFSYIALPIMEAIKGGGRLTEFDLVSVPALLANEGKKLSEWQFRLEEVPVKLSQEGEMLTVLGVPVNVQQLEEIMTRKWVEAFNPVPRPSPECLATESNWSLCLPEKSGYIVTHDGLGGWYKGEAAPTPIEKLLRWRVL